VGASHTVDRRVPCDFAVDFANGGMLQGQNFKLDIEGEDVSEGSWLATPWNTCSCT